MSLVEVVSSTPAEDLPSLVKFFGRELPCAHPSERKILANIAGPSPLQLCRGQMTSLGAFIDFLWVSLYVFTFASVIPVLVGGIAVGVLGKDVAKMVMVLLGVPAVALGI